MCQLVRPASAIVFLDFAAVIGGDRCARGGSCDGRPPPAGHRRGGAAGGDVGPGVVVGRGGGGVGSGADTDFF